MRRIPKWWDTSRASYLSQISRIGLIGTRRTSLQLLTPLWRGRNVSHIAAPAHAIVA
jgi:hypothetical protein